MLLCCFKEPKRKKSTKDGASCQDNSYYSRSNTPSGTPKMGVSVTARHRGAKERAPMQKEEKRLLKKQISQESVKIREATSLQYIDQSPRSRKYSGKSAESNQGEQTISHI